MPLRTSRLLLGVLLLRISLLGIALLLVGLLRVLHALDLAGLGLDGDGHAEPLLLAELDLLVLLDEIARPACGSQRVLGGGQEEKTYSSTRTDSQSCHHP